MRINIDMFTIVKIKIIAKQEYYEISLIKIFKRGNNMSEYQIKSIVRQIKKLTLN